MKKGECKFMKWQFELSDCPTNATYPVLAHQINDNGVRKGPFYLRIEDLLHALKYEPENFLDADGERQHENSTPPLPVGTIRYSANTSKTSERVTMEIPMKQWEIRYGNEPDTFYTLGFPRMVVQYLVVKSEESLTIKEMRLYAVLNNGNPVNNETPLFIFPYPNVGKENGIVCWGQNERLEINSLVNLERAFLWFISAPFNEDHGVRTTLGIHLFKKLIDDIQNKPFDDEWLMPANKVFGDLF
ncbi:hypothetical protein B14911_10492 [Bacillus sp. NRRL B-14911]|nr:hypothetical protein B14911_10492 [Bacillus sp. NRRL B-14911]